ncbi:MAG: HD domain-containing protein, partial [Muribaculaceae bacterium]|nr:HD domain-containing protein [Muribaculaceae bacterium]
MEENFFRCDESRRLLCLCRDVLRAVGDSRQCDDMGRLRAVMAKGIASGLLERDRFGFNPVLSALATAATLCESVSADRNMVLAVLLSPMTRSGAVTEADIAAEWGDDVAKLVRGLDKVGSLYSRGASVESENFRKLLLTFAEDLRVIIIMIVDRLTL